MNKLNNFYIHQHFLFTAMLSLKEAFKFMLITAEEANEQWKQLHSPGSGMYSSSMVSDFCGFGYKSLRKRYLMMKCPGTCDGSPEKEENSWAKRAMDYGNAMEDPAVAAYYREHPYVTGVKPGIAFYKINMFSSTDRLLYNMMLQKFSLLEVKCPMSPKDYTVREVLKLNWIAQCHWEMACWRIYDLELFIYQPGVHEYAKEILWKITYSQEIVDLIESEIKDFEEKYWKPQKEPTIKRKNPKLLALLVESCTLVSIKK
jgi:hypothetical protein